MSEYYEPANKADCERIADVALAHRYMISLSQAEDIWNDVSETFAAGWLYLPDSNEELWLDIEQYLVGKYPFIKVS